MTTRVFVLHGGGASSIPSAVKVRTKKQARAAYASPNRSLWFAPRSSGLDLVTGAVRVGKPRHALLALEKLSDARRVLLDALFAVVVEPGPGTKLLPADELREVLAADDRQDLFVGARAVAEDDVLVLFRGDLRSLIVPLSTFAAKRGGPKPDAKRVSVTDHGQTVRLGDYEIAADALLYELDPEARRRARKRALDTDDSLGASIRRLRLQRGLSREGFSVSAKTLARIERGETTPRKGTIAAIAKRLGTTPGRLAEY